MARKKTLDKKTNGIVKDYKRALNKSGFDITKLIVFGSYAKGTQKSYSDIDLCVVSKDFGKSYFDDLIRLNIIKDNKTASIEPHPLNLFDLNDTLNPLACEVKKHGIEA